MNLELYSIQFRNPETGEIITFTLEDYFVKDSTGKNLSKNSEEYQQISFSVGLLLVGGVSSLKDIVPSARIAGDNE